jgi:hypothetical protein
MAQEGINMGRIQALRNQVDDLDKLVGDITLALVVPGGSLYLLGRFHNAPDSFEPSSVKAVEYRVCLFLEAAKLSTEYNWLYK